MNEFINRTIFGALYVAVVVCCVVFSQTATLYLFLAVTIAAVLEFHKLMKSPTSTTLWSLCAAVILYWGNGELLFKVIFILLLIGALVAEVFRRGDAPIRDWSNVVFSVFMLAWPLSLMNQILEMGEWSTTRYILLALFVCIWANDSGAYCVGSLIGKHKMIPRVSPGKSWEGLVGGFIFSLIAGYIFSIFVKEYSLLQWLIIAFTISVFGTLGDLVESMIKRSVGVKDSGKFLPGHGGVLDRFDSILLATPVLWLLLQLFESIEKL